MQNFLIIQTAFLGDVILMIPIISELKLFYPTSKVDVVVRKGNESLLANNPKVNKIIVWDKQTNKYGGLFQVIKEIRKTKYDEVFTLQRYTSAAIMTLFAKSPVKIGFDRNSFSWMYDKLQPHDLLAGKHEVERNLSLIKHHKTVSYKRPELYPSIEDNEKVSQYRKGIYFCLAPASVWETKRLPNHKWVELIKQLVPLGKVYLIGGPADAELCDEIIQKSDVEAVNLAGKLSLLQSAALMEKAKMNFVNDSGPMHIASAMNAPVRAFFTSTIPLFGFGPLSEDSKVIKVEEKLSCRPCTFHGKKECPLKHYKCGNDIDVSLEKLGINL